MDAQGRKEAQKLLEKLEELNSEIGQIGEKLQEMAEDEREKFDSLPDSFQESEVGQKLEEVADQLDDAVAECESGNCYAAIEALEALLA